MKLPAQPPIYLDHHATTPVDPRVAAVILDAMTFSFGNANSVEHLYGEVAADTVTEARRDVAELVGAGPEGVHFTSGSTESIWLAISHAIASCQGRPLRVALSTVEHRAVLDAVAYYERNKQVVVRWVPVDGQARLDMTALKTACQDGVDLVCLMAANNEVGTDWDTNTGSDSDPCSRNCATHADASRVGAGGCDRRCRVAGGVGDHAGGAPTRVTGPALPGSRHRDAVRIRVGRSPPILDEKHALSVGHDLDRLGLRGGRNIRGGTGFPSRHGRFGRSPRQSRGGSTVRDGNQRRRGGGPRLGGKRSGVLRRDHRRTIRLLKAPAPTGGEGPDHGFSLSS